MNKTPKIINTISNFIFPMGKRDGEILRERSATCKTCGLTARNQYELDDHVSHAHEGTPTTDSSSKKISSAGED
jgi:hypothetical protein